MSDFRADGHAAVEWAAAYLDRVGELPVLAQVAPGDIRARLPETAPDDPEPFSAVLRDLDEILLPGITHWQHPRYFAYFATTRRSRESWPSCSPRHSTRLRSCGEPRRRRPSSRAWCSTGLPTCSGYRRAGTATSRTPPRPRRSLRPSRPAGDRSQPDRLLRAGPLVGREGRADARDGAAEVPVDELFRMRADALGEGRRCGGGGRDRRHDGVYRGRSGAGDRRRLRSGAEPGSTSMPPTPAPRWCAPSSAGRLPASSAPTRLSSTRTSGC